MSWGNLKNKPALQHGKAGFKCKAITIDGVQDNHTHTLAVEVAPDTEYVHL
jgi:hypothetical protein